MSRYDGRLLAARFAALAPEPLAGNWADVRRRAGGAREDKRSLERSRARQGPPRRFFIVLAVAFVAVVGTTAAFGIRAVFLDRGFIGLPPEGATPSALQSGELVVQAHARSATLAEGPNATGRYEGPLVRLWVYADGRVVWDRREGRVPEGAREFSSCLLEQRLTPEGVGLVRSEIAASGLFDRDLDLLLSEDQLVPGHPGFFGGAADVRDKGRLVRLQWKSPLSTHPPGEWTTATPEQISALRRLDALFSDPASVLPSSAWAERQIRAYVPSHYGVCVGTAPPADAARLVSLLPARAAELLRDMSWTRSESSVVEGLEGGRTKVLGRSVRYCSTLATEEAHEVADALSGLDPDTRFRTNGLAYVVAEPGNSLLPTTIGLEPRLPHQE
jgi:hypothetical protein